MWRSSNRRRAGDTVIEVMFATSIASLIIILAITLMNRSFGQIQMAAETTFVRQAIDGQAETIRYARDTYLLDPTATTGGAKVWSDIVTKANASGEPTPFGTCNPTLPPSAFFIASKAMADPTKPEETDAVDLTDLRVKGADSYTPAQTYARIGQGIWIEAVKGGVVGGPSFIDFHIRACWEPPFSGPDNATLGTIVRLYYE